MKSRLLNVNCLMEKIKSSGKNLKILDSTFPNKVGIQNYIREKIIGSQFLFLENLSEPNSKYSNTFPSPSIFKHITQKLGISPENEIIFYDTVGTFYSPRAYFVFKAYNYQNIYLLDGGLPKWKSQRYNLEENNQLTEDIMKDYKSEQSLNSNYRNDLLVKYEEIKAISERKTENPVIIDSRPSKSFNSANIPNSTNFDYNEFFNNDKTLKSKEEFISKFKEINVNPMDPIITSCGIGISASVTHFILSEIIGNSNIRMYDGSFEEYSDKTKK